MHLCSAQPAGTLEAQGFQLLTVKSLILRGWRIALHLLCMILCMISYIVITAVYQDNLP